MTSSSSTPLPAQLAAELSRAIAFILAADRSVDVLVQTRKDGEFENVLYVGDPLDAICWSKQYIGAIEDGVGKLQDRLRQLRRSQLAEIEMAASSKQQEDGKESTRPTAELDPIIVCIALHASQLTKSGRCINLDLVHLTVGMHGFTRPKDGYRKETFPTAVLMQVKEGLSERFPKKQT